MKELSEVDEFRYGPGTGHLPALRALALAFNSIVAHSNKQVRKLKLTTAQFDVIATLGDTEGMTFKDLSQGTLVTKGTLTGVVDRLEDMNLVKRVPHPSDRRSTIVQLTDDGHKRYRDVYPTVIEHTARKFDQMSKSKQQQLTKLLIELYSYFKEEEQFGG